jgi:HNH endonuclease
MPRPKNRTISYWATRRFCSHECAVDPQRKLEDVLNNYDIDPVTGCWVTRQQKDKDGYGEVHIGRVHWRTHRLFYTHYNGDIPKGMLIRHSCDNPPCVNPGHLLCGSAQDNVDDMMARNRNVNREGEANTRAKLTDADVLKILNDSRRQQEIADDYGVNRSLISMIKNGRRWAHLHRNET